MSPNLNITWFKRKSNTGGAAYETYLMRFLSKSHKVNLVEIEAIKSQRGVSDNFVVLKLIFFANMFKLIKNLFFLKSDDELVIRDFFSTAGLLLSKPKQKNIVLIHHIDSSVLSHRSLYKLFENVFYSSLIKADVIVTVSNFWRDFFIRKGYRDVRVIYNPFDLAEFNITEEDISNFKKRYDLIGRPVVYIGNCQKEKGVVETFNALKDLPVTLITSGEKQVDLPVPNLDLSYRDYLTLLKISDVVVLMSRFLEGWNRTAHEAMILSRPVVGNGTGGMAELLEGGKQVICRDFSELSAHVEEIISDPELSAKLSRDGRIFAEKFDITRFEGSWSSLIDEFVNNR
jgi:glycosyltransferase involved in cell wall biosynthesis